MSFNLIKAGSGSSALATTLAGKDVPQTRFATINSATSGTIAIPSNLTILLNRFGGDLDCYISQIASGKPSYQPALTSAGQIITATFDALGAWVLSGTPTSYPIALIYRGSQALENFTPGDADFIDITDLDDTGINIQVFQSSGTWYKPTTATGKPFRVTDVYACGAGGGAGSGRRDAAGTIRCGGGAGAHGGLAMRSFSTTLLGSTETITVGAGGVGGLGKTTDGDGNPGTAGGTTSFGTWLKGLGGSAGSGGTSSAGTGGVGLILVSTPFNFITRNGGNASTTGTNAGAVAANDVGPTSGGAGGGVSAANASGAGANGGNLSANVSDVLNILGGLAAGAAPAAAGNGNSANWIFGMPLGTGGGGGRGGVSTDSGAGGNGGDGGGGGGVTTGFNGGNGGNGGNGWCVAISYA